VHPAKVTEYWNVKTAAINKRVTLKRLRQVPSVWIFCGLCCSRTLKSKVVQWRQILHRLSDLILWWGEGALQFKECSHLIGDPKNGNFGVSHYDLILKEHLNIIKEYQRMHTQLQVHYTFLDIKEKFI